MPLNADYSKHSEVIIMVEDAVSGEFEQRKRVKEQKLFIYAHDGQWDPDVINRMSGRFRGTFDQCLPIVENFQGEVIGASFTLRATPKDGLASKENAEIYDGMFRNIRNVSGADALFNKQAVSNFVGGFDCVEIIQKDNDSKTSFDQDLFINPVANAGDSVWFDPASIEQDRTDSNWGVKKVTIPSVDYEARWSEEVRTNLSMGENHDNIARQNSTTGDTITVAQFYYKKEVSTLLVQMSNGDIYEDDEEFKSVEDELLQSGLTVKRRKKAKVIKVFSRMMDGGGWLNDEQPTAFNLVPLAPIYGNYEIIDNAYYYFGKISRLMDPQRGFNYAKSREIDDEALSPTEKIAMTDKQISGNEAELEQLNVAKSPILKYTPDGRSGAVPPFKLGANQTNVALQSVSASMEAMINKTSNSFDSQLGNARPNQSGIAGTNQIDQGNLGNTKWMEALQIQICAVGKILIPAIPIVYDGTRQERILAENGDAKMVTLNTVVFDEEQKKNVDLHKLSHGTYDVTCEMGPAFKSSQKEAERGFNELSVTNPEAAALTMDLKFDASTSPGSRLAAERFREKLFNNGDIPESQWTDEEKERVAKSQAEAQNQPPQEDAATIEARGVEASGQADVLNAQTKQQEAQFNQQVKIADNQIENRKLDIKEQEIQLESDKFKLGQDDKFNKDAADIDQGQQKIEQANQQMVIDTQQNQDKIDLQAQKQQFDEFLEVQKLQQQEINDAIANLKTIQDAAGSATIVGPGLIDNMRTQSDIVSENQLEE